jgi:hypothetical protein
MIKIVLGLRENAHQVDVITPNGTTRPVLGTAHPEEQDRRANVVRQWGGTAEGPREQRLATIDEPLAQRSQTILSYQVSQALRARLNGAGAGHAPATSRRNEHEASTEVLSGPDGAGKDAG